MAKVPLLLMMENEVLLEEHLLRLLDLHVSLMRIPSELFWKGYENLKINFFSPNKIRGTIWNAINAGKSVHNKMCYIVFLLANMYHEPGV